MISTTFDLDGSCRLMTDSERLEKSGQVLHQIRPGRRVLMPLEAMDETELDIVAWYTDIGVVAGQLE